MENKSIVWIKAEQMNGQKVLDEVDIDGQLWVEISDLNKQGDEHVQSSTKQGRSKNALQNKACLQKAND